MNIGTSVLFERRKRKEIIMHIPRLNIQQDEPEYQPLIAVSPETESVLQALEQGQRSKITPMPWPTPRRDREPRESA